MHHQDNLARPTAPVIVLVALLAMITSACSGKDDKTQTRIDACKLIDPARAAALLGGPITVKPVNTDAAGAGAASMCQYQSDRMGDSFLVIAGTRPYDDASAQMADRKKEILDNVPEGMDKPGFEDIKGLGEAATLVRASGYMQLHVLADGKVLVINRNHEATPEAVGQVEELARMALQTW